VTWVKICGMTNLEDAEVAVEAGADAVGFVFYEQSPRNIDPAAARNIAVNLPQKLEKVGVFVNRSIEEVQQLVEQVGLSAVQFYPGRSSGTVTELLALKKNRAELKLIVVCPADELSQGGLLISEDLRKALYALMFDSGTGTQPGGTGKRFDWNEARGVLQVMSVTVPVIVAGGLNPTNVAEAISLFQPYGVDVASGVERQPGKKDPEKVRAFVKAVREADQSA
jgi:phosphoribosylanthranilate isomerase